MSSIIRRRRAPRRTSTAVWPTVSSESSQGFDRFDVDDAGPDHRLHLLVPHPVGGRPSLEGAYDADLLVLELLDFREVAQAVGRVVDAEGDGGPAPDDG